MSSIIDRYNRAFEKKIKEGNRGGLIKEDIFSEYKKSMNAKAPLEMCFEFADEDGNLYYKDENGVSVVLKREVFEKDVPYYSKSVKDRFIGLNLMVKVDSIDEENRTVYTSSSVDKNMVKGSVIKGIFKCLRSGEKLATYGDVIAVYRNKVLVNILQRGVFGIIDIRNWQDSYVRDLTRVVKVGDTVKFDIIGEAPRKKHKDYAFICDRRPYAPDPWSLIPDLTKGSTLLVQCIEKPAGKSYFWGISKMTPGIEVMCDYNPNLRIMNSCVYKSKVLEFDRSKRILKVVPFELAPVGIGTAENVSFVQKNSK